MEDTKIALVQMQSKAGRIKDNLKKIEEYASMAAGAKADFVCFPELSLHGYNWNIAKKMAEMIPGDSSKSLCEISREYGLIVMAGMVEDNDLEKPYITHVIAFPDGSLKKYRKTHLGKSEKRYFSAGDEFPVFHTAKACFGVEICWDLHFPEVTAILSLKGAEIIFAPHASPLISGERGKIWLKYLPARSYDNAVFIAACNLVGDDGTGKEFSGGAMVIDPKGRIIAKMSGKKEKMIILDLESNLINTIRSQQSDSMRYSFYLHCRRPELYKELINTP